MLTRRQIIGFFRRRCTGRRKIRILRLHVPRFGRRVSGEPGLCVARQLSSEGRWRGIFFGRCRRVRGGFLYGC
jgi:hypothetical protein